MANRTATNENEPAGARATKSPAKNAVAARPFTTSQESNLAAIERIPSPPVPKNFDPQDELGALVDQVFRAALAKATAGLSPAALTATWTDWAIHLAASPGKQGNLVRKAWRKYHRLAQYVVQCSFGDGCAPDCILPLEQDSRFRTEAWQKPPFNVIHQAFLLNQQWWHNVTTGIRGVTPEHERVATFAARQWLDMFSPSNFLMTNPELLEQTQAEGGMNLIRGAQNFIQDMQRQVAGKRPGKTEGFEVGETLATAPGKVVYRNRLIELIQYEPTTDKVHPEPVLIVPAWIMKYYILDLSPENSMVRYLTSQGYTVFMISWKNPGAEDRDLGMKEYRMLGPMAALDVVNAICGPQKVHAVGYCLGGTLLSIAAAAMARDDDDRLASVTLFAAQADFTEAGELMLFVSESEITFLEDLMWQQGYLDTTQMAGAFQLLNSNDLIWSRMVKMYMMGQRPELNDLMAWNADATRMPYQMHSEYLRSLFLNNELAEEKFTVNGRPVALSDIRLPIFALGTETDHVAPWKSAYKIHSLTDTDVTFALTKGGHNAGVVSEPGHPQRHFRIHTTLHGERYLSPDEWVAVAELREGSWWPAWTEWLAERSAKPVAPPPMGAPGKGLPALADAPGTYVLME